METLIKILTKRMVTILFVFFLLVIIVTGNTKSYNVVGNINKTKSLSAYHLVNKYDDLNPNLSFAKVSTLEEIKKLGATTPVEFKGQMTGYGPDCPGCGGRTGCSPYQDVRKNNIYFDDNTYGEVRIIATDKAIPCGSIIKVSNVSWTDEEFVAIALDRGGAIKGLITDLLFKDEKSAKFVGRQRDVNYKIIRWGW